MTRSGPYVHPTALVETASVGDGTRIWAFAHLLPGAVVGRDCNICDHVFVEGGVRVGDRVTVKCGVQLWTGVEIEDDVFVGPNATFTNDPFPRSRAWRAEPVKTLVRRGASIGANATLLPGIVIGQGAMIGAGAVVTHDVPPHAIVTGNPAAIDGYTRGGVPDDHHAPVVEAERASLVAGVRELRLPAFADMRGSLTVAEFDGLPFVPRRVFWVASVPTRRVRGERAHRRLEQVLICVDGECCVLVDDGQHREEHRLAEGGAALYIPPMVWFVEYRFSRGAVLLVLASSPYDPADYIRDYEDFVRERAEMGGRP